MSADQSFRVAEQVRSTDALARLASTTYADGPPSEVENRIALVLTDLLGITLAGMRTPELVALGRAWQPGAGDTRTVGSALSTTIETACFLDAIGSCCLELDEGNKYAAGHPAAHVVFAGIAAARLSDRPVTGRQFVAAVAAGYEVAARFGHAMKRDPRWHPHGHWGAAGAACASSLILGATTTQVAAAIDASAALVHVSPWEVVLEGDFARNLWIAGANRAGLEASRLALAGLVANTGSAQHTFGSIVGSLDPCVLVEGLGSHWLTLEGYIKQHASCSYTHAAVDAIQALKAADGWVATDVAGIVVRTHSLAEPLFRRNPTTRLAAMFSLPFVVAAAVVNPSLDAHALVPGSPAYVDARRLSALVQVETSVELDRVLPRLRCAEVTVELTDGATYSLTVPNPIGDVDHFPLSMTDVCAKLSRLVGEQDTQRITAFVDALDDSTDLARLLDTLP